MAVVKDSADRDERSGIPRIWLTAGQELLRKGGIGAVKLADLTTITGLSTGSFYHHFSSMRAYRHELARFYSEGHAGKLLRELSVQEPETRLTGMWNISSSLDALRLDAAMRAWAADDDTAARAVQELDSMVMNYIADTLEEMGIPKDGARLRALLMMRVATSWVIPPWPVPDTIVADTMEFLTRP